MLDHKTLGTPLSHTVGGRNPAPVDMVNIPLFTTGYIYIPGGAGFLPSTVSLAEGEENQVKPGKSLSGIGWKSSTPLGSFPSKLPQRPSFPEQVS